MKNRSAAEFTGANPDALSLFAAEVDDAWASLNASGIDRVVRSGYLDAAQFRLALSSSPYMASIAMRYADDWVAALEAANGALPEKQAMQTALAARCEHIDLDDQNGYMQQLREYRNLTLATIALYDLSGIAEVRDVLTALSHLAEVCIVHAVERAQSILSVRFGDAQSEDGTVQSLIVVAMGKLGGEELNFSSDVDLVFLHRESGDTSGPKSVDNEDYFRRVGQLAIKFLDSVTGDGFVYRVDMRLRPLGRSGPLVINLDAMENYLITQGRDWERFAWIKARALCGSDQDKQDLKALLKPFIYRRYLDYSVFDSLRDLKRQIGVKVDKQDSGEDIKLGRGGIREIEFITQSFQLVRGGREQSLQVTGLHQALQLIDELDLLESTEVDQLLDAYYFLRRVENRLQMVNDQQTHYLPEDEIEHQRLALSLCYDDYNEFKKDLGIHQDIVQNHFDLVFSLSDEASDSPDPLRDFCLQLRNAEKQPVDDSFNAALTNAGFTETSEIISVLKEFYRSSRYQRYPVRARELMDELLPRSLNAIGRELQTEPGNATDGVDTFKRLLELFHAVSGRSGYLQLLADSDETLANLLRLMLQSPWLAEYVASHPMVLDELLDISRITVVESVQECAAALRSELALVDADDLGELMDRVRHFQQARTVRIAAADISGNLPVMKVSDALTWLAEAVLQVSTEIVQREMQQRHGAPGYELDGDRLEAEFSVVAYGKLGGIELGYGSDLDIVFLYHSEGRNQVSGSGEDTRSLENQVYFSRLAQKLVHFLATLTPAGVLYEIDTRLRPNGRSGVLVISLAAFRDYQLNSAWTWEHQALVRARVVLGTDVMRERFDKIRSDVIQQAIDADSLQTDVSEMRERMRRELDRTTDERFDLKQGGGGIADIEFMVQYLVLKHAADHAELLQYPDNVRQLEGLAQKGLLESAQVTGLTDAYLYFRRLYHRQSMHLQDGIIASSEIAQTHRDAVLKCWQQLMN